MSARDRSSYKIAYCDNVGCRKEIKIKAGQLEHICDSCKIKIDSKRYDMLVCDTPVHIVKCSQFMLRPNGTGKTEAVEGCFCGKYGIEQYKGDIYESHIDMDERYLD